MTTPVIFTPPFLLIRNDGETILFDDLRSLAVAVSAARIVVHDTHIEFTFDWRLLKRTPVIHTWIVRDDRGRTVKSEDITYDRSTERWWKTGREAARHAEALGLPIPRTGKKNWRGMMRNPKGMSAWRENAAIDSFDEVRPNGKIKLPRNSWDDVVRSCLSDRNWKGFRKTRWK